MHADQRWVRSFDETSTEFSKADERFQSTEGIHFGSGAQETGMRMKEGFDKGVDELSRCFVRREEFGGTLAPVGAELGGGDESTVRKG